MFSVAAVPKVGLHSNNKVNTSFGHLLSRKKRKI